MVFAFLVAISFSIASADQSSKLMTAEEYRHQYPVVAELTSAEYVEKFREVVCGGDPKTYSKWAKKSQAECIQKQRDTFLAKLDEKYPNTSWEVVSKWCKANPIDCADWEKVEDRVSDVEDAEIEKLSAKKRAEKKRKMAQALALFLKGVGDGLAQNNRVTCTTNQIGTTAYTRCW